MQYIPSNNTALCFVSFTQRIVTEFLRSLLFPMFDFPIVCLLILFCVVFPSTVGPTGLKYNDQDKFYFILYFISLTNLINEFNNSTYLIF